MQPPSQSSADTSGSVRAASPAPARTGASTRTRLLSRGGLFAILVIFGSVGAGAAAFWTGKLPFAFAAHPNGPGPAAGVAPPSRGPAIPMDLHILVDQFGYRPGDAKVAVVRSPRKGFDAKQPFEPGARYEVRDATLGTAVFSGSLRPWNEGKVQDSSGDVGWWFDFSSFVTPGRYYVFDVERGLRSATFAIAPAVYEPLIKTIARTYFYQRSAFEKKAPSAEACWADAPAYVGPGQDREARDIDRMQDPRSARDLSGGWFDAGDTNQYVTFATQAVHALLSAYRDYPEGFGDDFDVPESGNGVPDLLDEIQRETDWLEKMQNPDGSSLLKLGVLEHGLAAPPSQDRKPRFYVGPCTSATIASAGMLADAALVFAGIPKLAAESAELRERAVRGFDAYRRAPEVQTDCDDQRVVSGDADRTQPEQNDMAVEAAVYLFALTGEERFQEFVRARYRSTMPYRDFGWSRYDPDIGEALLFFTGLPQADPALRQAILGDKLADAREGNEVYGASGDDLYRNYLHDEQYHWGSNGMRVAYANSNLAMNRYGLDRAYAAAYAARAAETLHYIHGVNPFGIVYISNMYRHGASYSVNEIFHTWFAGGTQWSNALISRCGPPPGFLVGGPNAAAGEDGVPRYLQPPRGQPPQKAYRDWNQTWPEASYALTEPSNNYQANYLRLLAGVLSPRNRPVLATREP